MIRVCERAELEAVREVINAAAEACRGVIPPDRWCEPYMGPRELRKGEGIGSRLLEHLREAVQRPVLVGTWRAATWAVDFYEARGFRRVRGGRGDELLRRYRSIPERQVEIFVVLADPTWWERVGP